MNPATFNPDMLSSSQRLEFDRTGTFTKSRSKGNLSPMVTQPPMTPAMASDGSVDATTLQSGGSPTMPAPTALETQSGFQTGLEASIASAKTNLESTLTAERDAALKRQDELNKRLEMMMKESDPTKRATFAQEQQILQNQLNASQTASSTLEEDFNKRRQVVSELETLLTQGNQAIETARKQPVAMAVVNKSMATTAQMVQARAGVLSAVVSGLDGNINAAHSIINNASNAVAAVWQDQLAYNQAYMNLVNRGELAKNKIQDDYANSQIALAERSLVQLEKTKEHITKLMTDPQSAQFIADAGITLNDSVAEINSKMAAQAKRQEREETKNSLLLEGYEYVPFPGDRTDVVTLDIGGEKLSFVPPVDELKELKMQETKASIANIYSQIAERGRKSEISPEAQQKAENKREAQAVAGEAVIGKVNEALSMINTFSTGFIGGTTSKIPGSPAFNLDKTVETVKANLGFDRLQQMRDNSPTGGALGQVAVQELVALQSVVANLEVGQSPDQLRNNLKQIDKHYKTWLGTLGFIVAPDGTVVEIID